MAEAAKAAGALFSYTASTQQENQSFLPLLSSSDKKMSKSAHGELLNINQPAQHVVSTATLYTFTSNLLGLHKALCQCTIAVKMLFTNFRRRL